LSKGRVINSWFLVYIEVIKIKEITTKPSTFTKKILTKCWKTQAGRSNYENVEPDATVVGAGDETTWRQSDVDRRIEADDEPLFDTLDMSLKVLLCK
jgi:hypothetical protein